MAKVFQPLSDGAAPVFERQPQSAADAVAGVFERPVRSAVQSEPPFFKSAAEAADWLNDPERMRAILSGYSEDDLRRLFGKEVAGMDDRARRTLLERSGSVGGFFKSVMSRVAVRLVADKLVRDYGPAILGTLGLGAGVGVGSAVAGGADLLANLTPEQEEIFAPFLEHMYSHDVSSITDAVDPSDVVDVGHGIISWIESLFS